MVCCSAPNCSNVSTAGYRLFRFPSENSRRVIWLQNCRRDRWKPTSTSRLCEVHFEDNQWEHKRADGWKKLKPNAIPTLFNVPNPPRRLLSARKSQYKKPSQGQNEHSEGNVAEQQLQNEQGCSSNSEAFGPPTCSTSSTIAELQEEINSLKSELLKKNVLMKTFLNDEQISALERTPSPWSSESIIYGLKLRFSLGIHGYNYLRSTNYPIPSYSTLTKRIRHLRIEFGIFKDLLEPLKCKVEALDLLDRVCTLSIDEMEIIDFNKHEYSFCGNITLGNTESLGNHITLVLIRGVKSAWKQVIACEVTGPSTKGVLQKQLIERCVHFAELCGLRVISVSSDMGSNNRAMWAAFGVEVTRNESQRNVKFSINNNEIYVVPDVCHLLKNLKSAVLNTGLHLPHSLVENEGLPSSFVSGKCIVELWHSEIGENKELRLLHHLQRVDVEPSHFSKMNVGSAVRFFSVKTAAALELAVTLRMLSPEALTTAYFCRLIAQWFSICSSKVAKAGVTSKNKNVKFQFLSRFVEIFQNISISNGWKPLNTGMIMSTLSLCSISEQLLNEGYKFVLLHRFTQDAIENIFSQVRRKAGSCPSALQCLKALKLITVSQFISDVKRSSYFSDSDSFLIDHTPQNIPSAASVPISPMPSFIDSTACSSATTVMNSTSTYITSTSAFNVHPIDVTAPISPSTDQHHTPIDIVEPISPSVIDLHYASAACATPSTSTADLNLLPTPTDITTPLNSVMVDHSIFSSVFKVQQQEFNIQTPQLGLQHLSKLTSYDRNNLCNIGGSTTNALLKTKVCEICRQFLNCEFSDSRSETFINLLNLGGLKKPNCEVMKLICKCEVFYRDYKHYIMQNGANLVMEKILNDECTSTDFPTCCNLKEKVVRHFFKIRSYAVVDFNKNVRKRSKMYGTSSEKKRKL